MIGENLHEALKHSSFGYAYHRVIFDEEETPVDYIFLYVNPAFESLTGLSKTEILNRKITEALPNITADTFNWIFYYGNLSKTSGNVEFEQYSKTLNRWYKIQAFSSEKGFFGTIIFDITKQKSAEKEKALFYNALQSITQPVLIADNSGSIIEVNDAFISMYGYAKNELVGKNPNILNPGLSTYKNLGYTNKEYAALFKSMWESIRNPTLGFWEDVVVNKKKDGSLVWVKLQINAILQENNDVHHFIGIPVDISNLRKTESLSKIELFQTIADLAELRDNETGNHMRRVGIFSFLIAKEIGQPEKYCDDIKLFAPMHDIGKVGIPDAILLAARKLTFEEFEEMKKHSIFGYNIVKGKKELGLVGAISLSHHERWDGKGYPYNLVGEAIPLSARITSIADVYDALRSKRPYKIEWTHEEAKVEILKNRGTQFDPQLVDVFSDLCPVFEKIYEELRG